jgi:hypothetical protein
MNIVNLTPRQILVASILDGMNRYVNQVLIPANLVGEVDWKNTDTSVDSEICKKKYEIAEDIAAKWENALQNADNSGTIRNA